MKYRDILRNSFPQALMTDVDVVVDILPLRVDSVELLNGQGHWIDNLIHTTPVTVNLDDEVLKIPTRFYFNEPNEDDETRLSDVQRVILCCIYLRHSSGYVRERRLRLLLDSNYKWVIPFTIQLLGEYVFEIIEVLDNHVNAINMINYQQFVRENQKYWRQIRSRVISYWNEYYRRSRFPTLTDYLGQKIVDRINNVHQYHT